MHLLFIICACLLTDRKYAFHVYTLTFSFIWKKHERKTAKLSIPTRNFKVLGK